MDFWCETVFFCETYLVFIDLTIFLPGGSSDALLFFRRCPCGALPHVPPNSDLT
jgi:hypothetical protein